MWITIAFMILWPGICGLTWSFYSDTIVVSYDWIWLGVSIIIGFFAVLHLSALIFNRDEINAIKKK